MNQLFETAEKEVFFMRLSGFENIKPFKYRAIEFNELSNRGRNKFPNAT